MRCMVVLAPITSYVMSIQIKAFHHINCGVLQGFPAPRKAVTISRITSVDIANQLLTRHSPLAPLGQVDE